MLQMTLYYVNCDPARENWVYVHKLYLFTLLHLSHLLHKLCDPYKLYSQLLSALEAKVSSISFA